MVEDERLRVLSEIADLLEAAGESDFAAALRHVCSAPNQEFEEFLVSNELWGGSGSLADSAFAFRSGSDQDEKNRIRRKNRAEFEDLMIQLGRLQIAQGKTNIRTSRWVDAFEGWKNAGVYVDPA
jgi:hypothetical protein